MTQFSEPIEKMISVRDFYMAHVVQGMLANKKTAKLCTFNLVNEAEAVVNEMLRARKEK